MLAYHGDSALSERQKYLSVFSQDIIGVPDKLGIIYPETVVERAPALIRTETLVCSTHDRRGTLLAFFFMGRHHKSCWRLHPKINESKRQSSD
ncbi:MAG: hypothetical protein ABJA70_05730 [Chryseolinea sp.]